MSPIITAQQPNTADAMQLIAELDDHLNPLYAAKSRHGYSVEKLIAEAVVFFVLRCDGLPAGCGGIKFYDEASGEKSSEQYGEVKRMYVRPQFRGLGLSKLLLNHLEAVAQSRGITCVRLETGIYQPEALGLYERMGYYRIPPFGPYQPDPVSLCYEKKLFAD